MDLTSAAEANLNARVRPQIVALRSKTPYPKRRTDAGAAAAVGGAVVRGAVVGGAAVRGAVAGRGAVGGGAVGGAAVGARTPIKLTRRGRVVVGVLIGLAVAAVAIAIWFAVAGQAQASSQVGPRVPAGNSVARVVVRPGETLWGIAAKADPTADPRAVIGEIVDLNSLSSTSLQVGQVLLVPRS
jgi:LysM repeat protein